MEKTFSIITITYNNRTGFKKTAPSVLSQTCPDYEWIIIDGASTDGTQNDFEACRTATIISEPDNGIYDAMNKAIEKATGTYLIFMNAGDQFTSSETLDNIKQRMTSHSYDLIYGDSLEELPSGAAIYKKSKPHTTILHGMFTHHQAIYYNRHAIGKKRYDINYKIAADYAFTLDFLKEEKRNCLYIAEPLCLFECGGISQQNISLGRTEQYKARQRANVPPVQNFCITQKQKAASFLRRFFPNLYWLVKKLYS